MRVLDRRRGRVTISIMCYADAEMPTSVELLEDLAAGRGPGLVPLTVEQLHHMAAAGILAEGEAVELIEGMLVRKSRGPVGGGEMVHGPHHALVVARLQRLSARAEPLGCHLRSQLPVTLSAVDEPEPDLALVRGTPEDFAERHPGPAEILAVVEVADSSVAFDRTAKLRLYAASGIPTYWIVNIPEDRIEVLEDPQPAERRYARRRDVNRDGVVRLETTSGSLETAASDILPPRRA